MNLEPSSGAGNGEAAASAETFPVSSLPEAVRESMVRGEKVLWAGKPECFISYATKDPVLWFPFIIGAFTFGVPLIFIGFFALFYIPAYLDFRKLTYVLTDRRIMIYAGFFRNAVYAMDHDGSTGVNCSSNPVERLSGVGTVTINGKGKIARFYTIRNYSEVARKIRETTLDVRADISYPNASRPEENAGYNSKYSNKIRS